MKSNFPELTEDEKKKIDEKFKNSGKKIEEIIKELNDKFWNSLSAEEYMKADKFSKIADYLLKYKI